MIGFFRRFAFPLVIVFTMLVVKVALLIAVVIVAPVALVVTMDVETKVVLVATVLLRLMIISYMASVPEGGHECGSLSAPFLPTAQG